jgi:arsenate reductase-like glutaredoxin family protein
MEKDGWVGRPILVVDDKALTGVHRLAAAEELGLDVPVYSLDDLKLKEWLEKDNDIDELFSNRLRTLEEIGDKNAIKLMSFEEEKTDLLQEILTKPIKRGELE